MSSSGTSPTAEIGRLILSGNQDVRSAVELQRSLTDLISKHNQVLIDCKDIDSIDAACLQILLAARRDSQDTVEIVAEPNCEAARWIQYSGLADRLLGRTVGTSN